MTKTINKIFLMKIFCAVILCTFSVNQISKAQSTAAGIGTGNNFAANRFLGWGTTSGNLSFRTNNITRMTLQNNTGFVGIGTTAPSEILTLHRSVPLGTYTQYTNSSTGTGFPNGFFVGIASDGTADILQKHNLPIRFYTFNNNIAQFSVSNGLPSFAQGSVPGDGLTIRSLLNNPLYNLDMWVDRPSPPTVNQHIRWGQFGLVEGGSNRLQVIGFLEGLELIASSAGPIAGGIPRIIFRRNSGEIGRFGANKFLRIGDNPANTINLDATRRLEVVDPANAPQFRITQAQSGIASTVFTDFQTTAIGDMVIEPFNNSTTPRRVGVSTKTPDAKLDVLDNTGLSHLRLTFNDNITFTDFQTTSIGHLLINPIILGFPRFVGIGITNAMTPPGNTLEINSGPFSLKPSGLRFRNLTSASAPETNPSNNVLTVDVNGDVILVPDFAGSGGADADWFEVGTTTPPNDINDNIYKLGGNTGMGINTPQHKLHIIWPHKNGIY